MSLTKTYLVTEQQSIANLCLTIYGTMDKLVQLMNDNGLSYITNVVKPGTQLIYDNSYIPNINRVSNAPDPRYEYPEPPAPIPDMTGEVILYPEMSSFYSGSTIPSVTGTYSFGVTATSGFIDTYGLTSSWLNTNTLYYTNQNNLIGGMLTAPTPVDGISSGMDTKSINYDIPHASTSPVVYTLAGTGVYGFSGDGGTATDAKVYAPIGVDHNSNDGGVYFADALNRRIRAVGTGGTISTVSGNDNTFYFGHNILASLASFASPTGLVCDTTGQVYVCDESVHVIRRIDTAITQKIFTIGGSPSVAGFSGDGLNANIALLNKPGALCIDLYGNIYVADKGNYRIRKIQNTTNIISTIAGDGTAGYSGDGGPAILAKINMLSTWSSLSAVIPTGMACDSGANLYFTDLNNNSIRKVNYLTGAISTICGSTAGVAGTPVDGALASASYITRPTGITIDSSDNIYFTEGSRYVRKIDFITGKISTIYTVAAGSLAGSLGISGHDTVYISNMQYAGNNNKVLDFNPVASEVSDIWVGSLQNADVSPIYNPPIMFNDLNNNKVSQVPLIQLQGSGASASFIKNYLVPTLTLSMATFSAGIATIKLERGHSTSHHTDVAGFAYNLTWDNLTSYILHPDPLGDANINYVYAPIGTYRFGVIAQYTGASQSFGRSSIYEVIEITYI